MKLKTRNKDVFFYDYFLTLADEVSRAVGVSRR